MDNKINCRRLGTAVLVYAFFTAGALLSLVSGTPDAVNGVIWFLYVVGGIGLLRKKQWGRVLTIIATGGSVIAMLFFPIHLVFMATVWPFWGIPALLLLFWSWRLKLPKESPEPETPPSAEHQTKDRRRNLHNIAYKCYLFLGLIAFWVSLWAFIDPEPGVIGFLVMIPFGIPLFVALILGFATTLYQHQDFRLLILLVLTFGAVSALPATNIKSWPAFLIPYGAITIVFATLWFRKYRDEWYAPVLGR